MKFKKFNKKLWLTLVISSGILVSATGYLLMQKQIVFATDGLLPSLRTQLETKEKVNVSINYLWEDGTVYKEHNISANRGQELVEKDLPPISKEMEFVEAFSSYLVKGDGYDKIELKVRKSKTTSQYSTEKEEKKEKEDSGQRDSQKNDIEKINQESKELNKALDTLKAELKDKSQLNEEQKKRIKELEEKNQALQKRMEKAVISDGDQALNEEIEKLKKQMQELQEKSQSLTDKAGEEKAVLPQLIQDGQETISSSESPSLPSTTVDDSNKEETSKAKKEEIRTPNKDSDTSHSSSQGSRTISEGNTSEKVTKGIPSAPSKARGTITENKDNANKDYPIHHGDERDKKEATAISADARQFVTFTTKSGKTFHLIINHDKENDNVQLLTEVSEDDLLNMVQKKEVPKQEIIKEEPKKEEVSLVKKEEESNMGMYFIVFLVVVGALGAGYYFKVIKQRENKELEHLEEDEHEDFFSETDDNEDEEEDKELADEEDEVL